MDTLRGISEHEETTFGESIVARDEALNLLTQVPGLGPPDLVWLQKVPAAGTLTGRAAEPRGYYHYALGREVASSASVAAYFAQISNLTEPPSFFQGLWLSGERKVDRGFYCCYEPLSRHDVRCELCVPGGVTAVAIDSQGEAHPVTDWLWARCQLATFLRAELLDAELLAQGAHNLLRFDPVPDMAAEEALLDIVDGLYREGLLPGGLDVLAFDQAGGCTAEQMDLVLFALFHHFGRRQRWAAATDFFERLAGHYGSAAVYVAASMLKAGRGPEAMEVLLSAAEREPFNAQVLVALATEYMYRNQLDAALKLARRAVRAAPGLRPGWLLLARCYAQAGELPLALLALNATPAPALPVPEEELLFGVPPPKPKGRTRPKNPPYDCDVAAATQLLSEEAGPLSERASHTGEAERPLAHLPGAVLVNLEPPDCAAWADVAPYRATRAALAAVYGVLQEIVCSSGWDDFLDIRSEVFVMYTETARAAASSDGGGEADGGDGSDGGAAAGNGGKAGGGDESTSEEDAAQVHDTVARSSSAPIDAVEFSPKAAASPAGGRHSRHRGVGSFLADAAAASPTAASAAAAAATAAVAAAMGLGGAAVEIQAAGGAVGGAYASGVPPSPPHQSHAAAPAELPLPGVSSVDSDLQAGQAGGGASGPAQQQQQDGGAVSPGSAPRLTPTMRLPGMARRLPLASQASVPHFLSAPVLAVPLFEASSPPSFSDGAPPPRSLLVPSAQPPQAPPHAPEASAALLSQALAGMGVDNAEGGRGASPPQPSTAAATDGNATASAAIPPAAAASTAKSAAAAADLVAVDSSSSPADGKPPVAAAAAAAAVATPVPAPKPSGGLWNQLFGPRAGPVGEGATTRPPLLSAALPGLALPHELWSPEEEACATSAMRRVAAGSAAVSHRLSHLAHLLAQTHPDLLTPTSSRAAAAAARTAAPSSTCRQAISPCLPCRYPSCISDTTAGAVAEATIATPPTDAPAPQPRTSATGRIGPHLAAALAGAIPPSGVSSAAAATDGAPPPSQRTSGGRLLVDAITTGVHGSGRAGDSSPRASANLDLGPEGAGHSHSPAEARPEPRGGRQPRRSDALRHAEEVDREGAVVGRMPEAPPGGGGGAPKRVCVRWLDELIVAFWHDLQAYLEWQALDREMVSVAGQTHAGLLLDLPPLPEPSPPTSQDGRGSAAGGARTSGGGGRSSGGRSAGGAVRAYLSDEERDAVLDRAPQLNCGDWVRRGMLGERLYHDAEALLAYRAALQFGFSLVAYNALMRLTAANGLIKQALQAVHQVMSWHDAAHRKLLGGGSATQVSLRPQRSGGGFSDRSTDPEARVSGGGGPPTAPGGGPGSSRLSSGSGRLSHASGVSPRSPGVGRGGRGGLSPVDGGYACPLAVLSCVSTLMAMVGVDAIFETQMELGYAMHPAVEGVLDSVDIWS